MEWLLSCDYGSIRHRNRWFLSKYFFFMLSFLAGIKGNVEFSSLQWWGWKGHIGCGGGTLIKVRLRDQVGDELDPWNGFGRGLRADLIPPCCHGHLPLSLSAPRPAQTGLGHLQGWGWCGIDWSRTEHGDAAVAGGQCSEAAGRVSLRWAQHRAVWDLRCGTGAAPARMEREGPGKPLPAWAAWTGVGLGHRCPGALPGSHVELKQQLCPGHLCPSVASILPFSSGLMWNWAPQGPHKWLTSLIPYPLQFLPCFFRSHVCFVSFFVGLVFFLDILELYIKFSSVHA